MLSLSLKLVIPFFFFYPFFPSHTLSSILLYLFYFSFSVLPIFFFSYIFLPYHPTLTLKFPIVISIAKSRFCVVLHLLSGVDSFMLFIVLIPLSLSSLFASSSSSSPSLFFRFFLIYPIRRFIHLLYILIACFCLLVAPARSFFGIPSICIVSPFLYVSLLALSAVKIFTRK